jgi:hypothetical protein
VVTRQRRDELVAEPAVEQVQALETVDDDDVDLGLPDGAGGRSAGPRCRRPERGTQGSQNSWHRRLHVPSVEGQHLQGERVQGRRDQRTLADPARSVDEHDSGTPRLEQLHQPLALGGSPDHGRSGRSEAVVDEPRQAGAGHPVECRSGTSADRRG